MFACSSCTRLGEFLLQTTMFFRVGLAKLVREISDPRGRRKITDYDLVDDDNSWLLFIHLAMMNRS